MSGIGIGLMPAGLGPFGLGTPLGVAPVGGQMFTDSTGKQQGSRYINPQTGDYAFDSNGRAVGMRNVRQLVQLRVATDKGSAAMLDLGNTLKSINRITDNITKRVESTLQTALDDLVSNNIISIESVSVDKVTRTAAGLSVQLVWRDVTTGKTFAEKIN